MKYLLKMCVSSVFALALLFPLTSFAATDTSALQSQISALLALAQNIQQHPPSTQVSAQIILIIQQLQAMQQQITDLSGISARPSSSTSTGAPTCTGSIVASNGSYAGFTGRSSTDEGFQRIHLGDTLTLSWNSSGATSATAPDGSVVPLAGSIVITPRAVGPYFVTLSNSSGKAYCGENINFFESVGPAATGSIDARSATLSGDTLTVSGTISGSRALSVDVTSRGDRLGFDLAPKIDTNGHWTSTVRITKPYKYPPDDRPYTSYSISLYDGNAYQGDAIAHITFTP